MTGTTGTGTWAYSLDGTTFTDVGTVSASSALLLPSDAELQYTPASGVIETPTITYRAWDTTTGERGSKVDTTTNGGTTAFSSSTDTAHLAIASGSISGYVFLDFNDDDQMDAADLGLAGVSVKLTDGSGDVSWAQTDAAGSYNFPELVGGTYQIQIVPSPNLMVGQNSSSVQLGIGENSDGNDFAVLGLQPAMLSLRMFLASTPPMPQVIQNMHAAPAVTLSATSTPYAGGGSPVAVVSSASISSPDSATLTSMTVTIQNLLDGSSENLQASTSGTPLTSNYANGVLTISGVADIATYQTVLEGVTYSDTASVPTIAARTISVVVNDGTASSAAATATLTVAQTATTTSVISSANPSTFGNSVTLTATVTSLSGGGTPTGSVTFMDGSTTLGTATITGGAATFAASALAVGDHSITAVYSGDANFAASTSATLTETVAQAATTTSVFSSENPSNYGDSVTLTAEVVSSYGGVAPTGSITFMDGDTTLGTVTINNLTATFTTAALTVGDHSITAVYSGDTNFAASTSATLTQTVAQAATTTGVVSSENPSNSGDSVTLTATVAPSSGSGTPTGSVTFMDGDATLGTVTITGGAASFATSALTVGDHSITAVYSGDANFSASTSATLTQTVAQAATTTSVVSSENPSNYGDSVTLTATVASSSGVGTPTGSVTFMDGSTTLGTATITGGTASFATSALAVGDHSITAVYSGDANFVTSASDTLTQIIA